MLRRAPAALGAGAPGTPGAGGSASGLSLRETLRSPTFRWLYLATVLGARQGLLVFGVAGYVMRKLDYPLVEDLTKKISCDYGVLLDAGIALRGLFLIDKGGVIRHATINDLPSAQKLDFEGATYAFNSEYLKELDSQITPGAEMAATMMPKTMGARRAAAAFIAASTSAVSPDCEMPITSVSFESTGFR